MAHVDGTATVPANDDAVATATYKQKASQAMMLLLSSMDRSYHINFVNCDTPKTLWDKIESLYGDIGADAKEDAWEQFYSFNMKSGQSIATQLESFEAVVKKLDNAGDKPSDEACISKILKSLPTKFALFRMAWDCTPKAERTKANLIARLIREDKKDDEEVAKLALLVHGRSRSGTIGSKKKVDNGSGKKPMTKKEIEELKKRTKCMVCSKKGHWARECPQNSEKNYSGKQALVCEVAYSYNCESEKNLKCDAWIADSGANAHMTFRRDFFSSLRPNTEGIAVKIADNRVISASGIGTIDIKEIIDGKVYEHELQDVLYVPEFRRSLFSITTVNKRGYSYHSYHDRCEFIRSDGEVIATGDLHDGLFQMNFKPLIPVKECNVVQAVESTKQQSLRLWHGRFGHVNVRAVRKTCEQLNIKDVGDSSSFFCEPCVMSKQTRKPHHTVERSDLFGPGEKVHSDLCGPINIESPRGSRYFLSIKDECTSFRKVYFLRHKDEVLERFVEFETQVVTQLAVKIKVVRSDCGTEYTCNKLEDFFKLKGIIHETSSPYIHEQNGRSEREIRTIVECARSMLIAKSVDRKLWTEAINAACYLLNRIILQPGETKTPFEKWFKKKPAIKHLRVFGSAAYLHIPKERRGNKFDPKSRKLIIVGYDNESTNYRLWDKEKRRIFVSSDVTFDEAAAPITQEDDSGMILSFGPDFDNEDQFQIVDLPANPPPAAVEGIENQVDALPVPEEDNAAAAEPPAREVPADVPAAEAPGGGRNLRGRDKLRAPDYYGCPVAFFAESAPSTYADAISSDESAHWKAAMEEELAALEENNTWTLCSLPPGKRAIGCKWVFAVKTDAAGNFQRYKARLVAKGFTQREGLDFFETFAPVVRYESTRVLISIAAERDLEMAKFDVKTAFFIRRT